jgi:hypothetical protein
VVKALWVMNVGPHSFSRCLNSLVKLNCKSGLGTESTILRRACITYLIIRAIVTACGIFQGFMRNLHARPQKKFS